VAPLGQALLARTEGGVRLGIPVQPRQGHGGLVADQHSAKARPTISVEEFVRDKVESGQQACRATLRCKRADRCLAGACRSNRVTERQGHTPFTHPLDH